MNAEAQAYNQYQSELTELRRIARKRDFTDAGDREYAKQLEKVASAHRKVIHLQENRHAQRA